MASTAPDISMGIVGAESPPPPPNLSKTPYYVMITSSLRSKVRALRQNAAWSFRRIANELGIAVSTAYSICKAPSTPRKMKSGRPKQLTTPIRKQLIAIATTSQTNRRLPLTDVANLAGIQASPTLLRKAFAQEGYHRRVAQVRPYLSAEIKEKRLDWAYHYADWTRTDWAKVNKAIKFAFLLIIFTLLELTKIR